MGNELINRVKAAAEILLRGMSPQGWLRGDDLGGGNQASVAEPYASSTWVQSAVAKVAGPISSVSVEFYGRSAEGMGRMGPKGRMKKRFSARGAVRVSEDEQIVAPGMEEFLRAPMKGYRYSDLVEAHVGWMKLAGESFWLLPDDVLVPGLAPKVMQIISARPDRMQHVVEGTQIVGWRYTDAAGRMHALLPEQVIHAKRWNPYSEWRGLSEYESARIAVDTDCAAGRFARSVMVSNGDTGPYIIAKNGVSDAQREQIVSLLRAKRAALKRGEFVPMFLTGDISVEDPKVRSVDAAFIATRVEDRHEIYAAFGVPMSMADVKAAYSIGSASDFYQLILNTCIPAGSRLCEMLDVVARFVDGRPLQACLNWDEHPVMQEVRKERLASVDVLWSKGMPMRDISEYLDLGLPEFEGWETGYLPFSVAPAGMAVQAETDASYSEPDLPSDGTDGQNAEEDHAKTLRTQRGMSRQDACFTGKATAEEVRRWREYMAKRKATVAAYTSKVQREIFRARAEVLGKLGSSRAKMIAEMPGQRAVAADFLFDLVKFTKGLQVSVRGVALDALDTAGKQLMAEIGKDDPWKYPPVKALEFLKERENKIAGAAEGVHQRIESTLSEGLEAGDSLSDLADRVRTEFNGIAKERAVTIAMTETSAAYGVSRQQAMADAGIGKKEWLTSGNSNVRDAHRLMNGAVVGIDEKFTVINPKTGESDQVSHPGDPDGAPWNVINCHCVAVPVIEEAK